MVIKWKLSNHSAWRYVFYKLDEIFKILIKKLGTIQICTEYSNYLGEVTLILS